jgi:hypothetical protein
MGRFLSPDDGSDQNALDPASWNLYSYVRNNPLIGTDPDGNACVVQTRTSATTETVSVASQETCEGVSVGDGQSATYVNGTVNVGDIHAGSDGHSIDIGFTSYDGSSSGIQNAGGAPYPDSPNTDPNWGNNAQGYGLLGAASKVVNTAGGIEMAAISVAAPAMFAADAGPVAVTLGRLAVRGKSVAEFIVRHAYDKHVTRQGEFGNISPVEFQGKVEDTMANPSAVRSLSNGRTAYWSDREQMVVIENSTAPERSTAFRPSAGKAYFDNLR